jgi:hypothetical protein
MNFKKKVILYMAVLLHIHGYSQLAMTSCSSLSGSSYLSLDDVWDLTVFNTSVMDYSNATVNLKINNDNGLVYETNATPLIINAGSTQAVNRGSFKNIKIEFADKNFKQRYDSLQIIPSGNYIFCYTIYSEMDSMALGTYCKNIAIQNIYDKAKKKKDIINSVGNTQFAGFYAFGNDTLPRNPGNYFIWRGNPTVEAYNIPVRADFQFNILNRIIDPATTYFNYTFDGDRLRHNLKNKAEKTAKDNIKKHDQYKLVYEKSQKELNKTNDILSNPGVQKEIYLSKVRDSLKTILNRELQPLRDSLVKAKTMSGGLQQTTTDSLSKSISIYKDSINTDTLNSFKNILSVDSLIDMINIDSKLLSKIPGDIDSLKLLIDKFKDLGYLSVKKKAYDELLKKKQKLELLTEKADSLSKLSSNSIDELKDAPFVSGIYNMLSKVQTLSYGTHVNTTSEFTCYGMPLLGLNFQTTNSGLILQYTNAKQTENLILNTNKYFHRHYSIYGAGYGNKDKWSVKLLYMSADDKAGKISLPADSAEFYGPSTNRIISSVVKIKIARTITVDAEFAGSETVKNKMFYSVANVDIEPTGLYHPRNGESIQNIFSRNKVDFNRYVGYAFKINAIGNITQTRTKITAGFRRTGKNFNTYGNPMLFKNALTADLKITQPVYKNNIKLGIIFKYNNFYKDSTTESVKSLCQYGVDLSVNFPKYPSLRLLFLPTQQIVNSQPLILNTINLISVYNYKIKGKRNLLTANGMIQNTSKNAINNYYFKSVNTGVSNIVQFSEKVSATVKYSYTLIGFGQYLNNLHSTELSGTYTLLKAHWAFNGAVLYTKANDNRKLGGSIEVQHPINEIFSFNFRVERNSYSNYITNPLYPQQYNFPSYNEWLLYCSLNIKW